MVNRYHDAAMAALNPTFLVLRGFEPKDVEQKMPGFLEKYMEVAHIEGSTHGSVSFHGLTYMTGDDNFRIFKRLSD
jgi:hypothetical protein